MGVSPFPDQVAQARAAADLTQRQAAALVHSTEAAWRSWESGLRKMHPGLWELFQIKTQRTDSQAASHAENL